MNRRLHQRTEVQNVVANLSNGVDNFSGTVNDVSRVGILLGDIPNELHDCKKKLSIIISANNIDYKLLVVPKWTSEKSTEKRMGLEIINAPLDWILFVMDYAPTDDNIWAATTNLPDC